MQNTSTCNSAASIRQQLIALCDDKFRVFSSRLMPGTENILGVRMPILRNLAKQIASSDWQTYISTATMDPLEKYFEEKVLHGIVIGYIKTDIRERLSLTAKFVPQIDNWAVCDSFCNSLQFPKEDKALVLTFLEPYISSKSEFEARFAAVMLLEHFISEEYISNTLDMLFKIKQEGYYARMAVAWALSICYIKFPKLTITCLKNNALDDFTYNKALQKIIESRAVSSEEKDIIRSMKRPVTKIAAAIEPDL